MLPAGECQNCKLVRIVKIPHPCCLRLRSLAGCAAQLHSSGAAAASSALTGHPQLRLYTRSCRLEMYVAEHTWERLPMCACFTN